MTAQPAGKTTTERIASIEVMVTSIHERLFGPGPASLQSQITEVKEATIGESPLSLRSRVTQMEQGNAVSRGRFALLASICSGIAVFLGTKWRDIAAFFGYHLAK